MPGIEIVRKQNTIGGAIGIAVLLLALGYRFLPDLLRESPQVEQQASKNGAPVVAPWSVFSRTPEVPPATPQIGSTLAQSIAMGPPIPVTEDIAALLKSAHAAEEQGKFFEPAEGSAISLYREVLQKDHSNANAQSGLTRIGGVARDWALAALERGEESEAQRYASLFAELPHSAQELTHLRARVKTLQEVMPLLARAADLLKNNRLVGTGDDNALAVYRQVLAIDPANRVADQGLAQIERGYIDRALAATAQDDFSEADAILSEVSSIRPGSQALLDARARVEGVRRQRGETILTQARSALDSGNADLAEELAQKAQAMSTDLAGLDEFAQRIRNARLYANFKPGQVFSDRFLDTTGAAPALVVIPTGTFVMGSAADEPGHVDNEEPQRHVAISVGFALGQTEISVGEFRKFVLATGYVTTAQRDGTGSVYDEGTGRMIDRRGMDWERDYTGKRAGNSMPVLNVSWDDANAYAAWLAQHTGKSYRLPSEAEFEYALRAGASTRYWWGDGDPKTVVANVTGDGDRSPGKRSWARAFPDYSDGFWGPAPVKSFPANPLGVYDMDGNVSEWVEDCWHANYTRAPRDSSAWVNPGCAKRVIRGGSWGSAPDQVRSAYRLGVAADSRSARVGFRVARDL
ncbi:MAG: SUMF1/EgtB/PvdO family nonheme iron enzyme [Dokdonella sp.]